MKRLVIGLGSGRSGTVSLSRLLDSQHGASVSHELRPLLPWSDRHSDLLKAKLRTLLERDEELVGDIAYYYLPYVERLSDMHPNVRFICLRRDYEQTVRSMMVKTEGRNHWVDHDGTEWKLDETWDATMPSYAPMPKEHAVRRYITEYYELAGHYEQADPERFRVFDLDVLNDRKRARDLLAFAGVEAPSVDQPIHENRLIT